MDQGATWPAESNSARPKAARRPRKLRLVEQIYRQIIAATKEKAEADMKAVHQCHSRHSVTYAMIPDTRGQFLMGSPPAEAHRNEDEGPTHEVKIEPFWMEKCKVTWNEYELFMYPEEGKPAQPTEGTTNYTSIYADAVTRPSKPYVEMSFGMGKDGYPPSA